LIIAIELTGIADSKALSFVLSLVVTQNLEYLYISKVLGNGLDRHAKFLVV
jgi:hypothetical protein